MESKPATKSMKSRSNESFGSCVRASDSAHQSRTIRGTNRIHFDSGRPRAKVLSGRLRGTVKFSVSGDRGSLRSAAQSATTCWAGWAGTVKLSRICPFCGRILLDQRLRINDLAVAAGGENAAKLLNLTVPVGRSNRITEVRLTPRRVLP